jgi:hypothetical protein
VGCISGPWVFFLLFLFGFFCGLFLGVLSVPRVFFVVFVGFFGLALVSPVYTCVLMGALRFFFSIIFLLTCQKNIQGIIDMKEAHNLCIR